MKKTLLLKTMLLLCALVVGSGNLWAQSKITSHSDIVDGAHYYIGATVKDIDYYFKANSTSVGEGIQGTSVTSTAEATEVVFEAGSTSGKWKIKIAGTSNYLSLKSSKDNGKVKVVATANAPEWTATTESSLIHLAVNGFCLQKNSGTSLNFGSYASGQKDVWLLSAAVPVTSITLNKTATAIAVGNTETLSVASVLPATATDKTVTWSSADDNIATVDASTGEVTAVAVGGPVNITATAHDGSGVTASCAVTVVDAIVVVTGVELNKPSTTLLVGGTETLTATVSPNDASDKSVTWESDDDDVATVDGGVVTAVGVGTATITVKSVSDPTKTATCEVTVNPVVVTGVALNKASTSIVCGSTETLTATVSPNNATNKNVSWESSNDAIASVDDDGVVTANAVGTATITVTTEDQGETATCTVTVTENNTKPELESTILDEKFSQNSGNETGTSTAYFDNDGWSKNDKVWGCDGYIRLASASADGTVTTPTLIFTGNATLTFKAKGKAANNPVNIEISNGSLDKASVSTSTEFVTYTIEILDVKSNPTITFTGKSGKQIFLDDVKIVQIISSVDVKLNAYGFASYCSPFALDLTPNADFAAYAVKAAGSDAKNQVVFTKIPGKVAANTPFILYNPAKASTVVSLPIIEDDDAGIAAVSANELVGTLSATYTAAASGQTNFGLSGANFVPMTAGVVKANKAYLPVNNDCIDTSAGAKALTIVFNDKTTGINGVEEFAPVVTKTRKVVKNGRLVIETANGEFTIDGARMK